MASGAEIIAEDLGVVPDFVRASLARLSVPGYKVFRWERHWDEPDTPFRDPAEYPPVAVATSGTHDTEPMTIWWEQAPAAEKAAVLAIPSVRAHLTSEDAAIAATRSELPHVLREALLESLYGSGANLLILPVQDVFGWRDRINRPATVSDDNWTWRLPWPSDRLATEPQATALADQLRAWSQRHRR
jgi:4-alpha-glucanotransferase